MSHSQAPENSLDDLFGLEFVVCVASSSMRPVLTTTQLLLCPFCSRAFKPSKNQNWNLRRHLKNVHNMSPRMHPRKCKRLWARKYRLRRRVEEVALVLSMLYHAALVLRMLYQAV
ncbi:hypothetical protein EDD21DRAFT_356250 [Dissophora ornata]|nr:hypothetical protein EDD21DRAFT_356250 [Dissophora ornata]